MIKNILLFLFGLVFLVQGSSYFVKSASRIAKKLGISEFIIGLTLVAVGTSLPELVSSIFASVKRESGLILGTIMGANIANITLIIGISAIMAPLIIKKQILKRDGYMLLFTTALLGIFLWDLKISFIEGLIFLLLFISYTFYLFAYKKKIKGAYGFKEFIPYFFKFKYILTIKSEIMKNFEDKIPPAKKNKIKKTFKEGLVKDFLIILISGCFIFFGAHYFVKEAIIFSELLKVPEVIIGVFIAIGTTLPELSVAVSASRKGYGNIAIGNAIGSCITNTLLILGVSALIHPLISLKLTLNYIFSSLFLVVIIFLIFMRSKWKIQKFEGILLILLYLAFIFFTLGKIN